MSQHLTPTFASQRIIILDVLRGFAILGILMVNMQWMNAPVAVSFSSVSLWNSFPDEISKFIIHVFFESKFYVLFSMLFGYGFYLFLKKPADNPSLNIKVYLWRLILLIIFGVTHVFLLWPGDILIWYGLLGLLLVLFRKVSDCGLLKWAIGILLIPPFITALAVLMIQLAMTVPEAAGEVEKALAEQESNMVILIGKALDIYSEGSFIEIFKMRLQEYGILLPAVFFFYPNVLAMFLIGQYAARKRYLTNIEKHKPFFKKLLKYGLLAGLPVNIIYGILAMNLPVNEMSIWMIISTLLSGFGGPVLTLTYVSAIVLLFHKGKFHKRASWLAPVGQMALTNYLLHSIIAAFLFHSYGLGLYGEVSIWQGIILTIIIFTLQIPFSIFWLKHFRFGPFEWLWRSFTYLKWQPLKK